MYIDVCVHHIYEKICILCMGNTVKIHKVTLVSLAKRFSLQAGDVRSITTLLRHLMGIRENPHLLQDRLGLSQNLSTVGPIAD